MSTNVINVVASYLEDLNATCSLCTEFGSSFNATNLLLGFSQDVAYDTVVLYPYAGERPNNDRYRQNPSVQIELRTDSKQKAITVQQELINLLHMNSLDGRGKVYATQSAPLIIGQEDGGKWIISVSNYNIKLVRD